MASKEEGCETNAASLVWRKILNVGSLWKARTLIRRVHTEVLPSNGFV